MTNSDIIILAAALADFIPKNRYNGKLKGSKSLKNIEIRSSVNVLRSIADRKHQEQIIVGFALENPGEENLALKKWKKGFCDVMVVNTPAISGEESGFGHDAVRALVISRSKKIPSIFPDLHLISKYRLADWLVSELNSLLLK
jgi:phosphopantothenoylcysteine decarboxylase/phosphopantothenate--cysteine ligase